MNRRQRKRRLKDAQVAPARKARSTLPVGRAAYFAGKAVDDHPESEWTYRVFVDRYMKGDSGMAFSFYEELHRLDGVVALAQTNALLEAGGAPLAGLANMTMGLHIFESTLYSTDGILANPLPGERWLGRHNVKVLGFDGERVVFENTWGARWGDRGVGYVGRDYFDSWVDTLGVVRRADIGVTHANWDSVMGLRGSPPQFAKAWLKRRSPWRRAIHHRHREHTVLIHDTVSVEHGRPVEVINLSNMRGELVAWMFVVFQREPNRLLVEELWVRPEFRRRGYGSLLGRIARGRAQEASYAGVCFVRYEADAYGENRAAGERLAQVLGLDVKPGPVRHRPNIVAVAESEV